MTARRRFPLLLLSALLLSCVGKEARPNIVLVVWDTCRGDRVSVNGYALPTTPRLADLAKEGTTFRRCYSPSPWTPPAHASLFTGLLPRNHGLREGLGATVRPGIPLLAETLRDAGYETVCAVANPLVSRATGLANGFDTAIECLGGPDRKGGGEEILPRLREALARRGQGGRERPLFLFVNLMETHIPYTFDGEAVAALHGEGATEGARRAAALVTDERASGHALRIDPLGEEVLRDLGRAYDGAVRRVDRVTGEILDLLRGKGLLDGSLLAVCGDHGENLGDHGDLGHLMSLHDPVLHVPLVLRWPGRFEGGRIVDVQVRLQDLYPTFLEAARVPSPPACGRDAASLLEIPLRPRTRIAEYGPALDLMNVFAREFPAAPPEAFVRFQEGLVAVGEGDRKYISAARHGDPGGPRLFREEFYDLAVDPGELRNLLPSERAAADRLRAVGEAGR